MPVTLNNTTITINDGTNNFVLETVKTHVPEFDIEVDIVPDVSFESHLIAWYKFEGTDENTIGIDSSGNGNDLVLKDNSNNNKTGTRDITVSGKFDNGFKFDGLEYFQYDQTSQLKFGLKTMTYSLWFNPNGATTYTQGATIISVRTWNVAGWSNFYQDTVHNFIIKRSNGMHYVHNTILNNWYPTDFNHLCYVFSYDGTNTTIKYYVNNILITTYVGDYTEATTSQRLQIGSADGYFIGQVSTNMIISDIRIYDRAFTQTEVSNLYNYNKLVPAMPVYEDTTHQLQNLAEQKTGVKGWRIVRFLPGTATAWHPTNDDLKGANSQPHVYGTEYNYDNAWSVSFKDSGYDEFCFSTTNFEYWTYTTKVAVFDAGNAGASAVIKSSINSLPHQVKWYYTGEGTTGGSMNEPWVSLYNVDTAGTPIPAYPLYGENSYSGSYFNFQHIPDNGGACVFVRNSTDTVTVNPEPEYKTLTFEYNNEHVRTEGMAENATGVYGWSHVKHLNKNATQWYPDNTEQGRDFFTVVDQVFDSHGSFTKPFPEHFDELLFTRSDGNGNVDRFVHCLKTDLETIIAYTNWTNNITSIQTHSGPLSRFMGFGRLSSYVNKAPMIVSRNSTTNQGDYSVYEEHYQTTSANEGGPWWAPVANKQYDVYARMSIPVQTSYTVNFPAESECDILIVGGGGGGGSGLYGGGGGAGGLVFQQNLVLNGSNTVKVGKGGNETNGFDSSINDIIAIGGGLGGSRDLNTTGSSGGSGGGGSGASGTGILAGGSGTAGQGNDGGDGYHYSGQGAEGGGGGGAGFAGNSAEISSNAGYKTGEKGGDGLAEKNGIDFKNHFAITDTNIGEHHTDQKVYFAGGGGGSGTHAGSTVGERGEGGLGGGGFKTSNPPSGARGALNNSGGGGGQADSGGSGIVIIRYKTKSIKQHPAYDAQWTYHSANPNVHHYGNVGIGTLASETNKLTVKGDINVIGDIYENNNKIAYGWDVSGNSVYNQYGNVGIGTNDPRYALHTTGVIYAGQGGITENTSTAWTVTSDNRIKENIEKASYDICSENIKNINLYRFNYNTKYVKTTDKNQLGFIAQDVRKYFPKAVKNKTTRFDNDVVPNLLSVDVTQLNYAMYGAVKHIGQDIDAIKEKLGITEVPTEIKNEPYAIEVVPFNDPDAELPTVNEEPATN